MKKALHLVILIFFPFIGDAQIVSPCLISSGIVTGNCTITGDAYIENPCISGIQKQIARSVNAEGLVDWITPVQCSGWIGVNGTPYDPALIPPGNTPVNCSPPYDKCYGHYCPDKYCSLIKTFVDLKASMILRAANTWSNHSELRPGTAYYQGMKQIVIDINAAYDCAGLKRPVIQGTIFENIDPSVNVVTIPPDVINAFKTTPGFDNSYYLSVFGTPKLLNFNKDRIRHTVNTTWPDCPDITKIEAKMWFYYLAKMYIDLGYRSIHMGQMNLWAAQDPSYTNTSIILNKIRAYAQSLNTFVLLTEENNRAKKFPSSNTFMYDYDSRAIRAREIALTFFGYVCGDFGCTNTPNNYLAGTPCANEIYPAIIDDCVISAGGNTSGNSPVSGCLLPYQPFNTYLDFGPGDYPNVGVASPGCQNQWGTWGWDDSKWFAQKISLACRTFWMQDAVCRVRQYFNGFGFMAAPGLLYVMMPTNSGRFAQGYNPTADARYFLPDEPSVKNAIISAWNPNTDPGIGLYSSCGPVIGKCDLFNLDKSVKTYHFYIDDPDCTSSYTWHIKNPDNSWQQMSYGNERLLTVPTAGTYTIYVRIDNLGLPSVKQISQEIYLDPYCCYPRELGVSGLKSEKETQSDTTIYKNLAENFDEIPLNIIKSSSNTLTEIEEDNIVVFPSPTYSIFTIKGTSPIYRLCSFIIKDVTGRTVLEKRESDIYQGISISCKNWNNGVYFIYITTRDGKNHTLKLVKL